MTANEWIFWVTSTTVLLALGVAATVADHRAERRMALQMRAEIERRLSGVTDPFEKLRILLDYGEEQGFIRYR